MLPKRLSAPLLAWHLFIIPCVAISQPNSIDRLEHIVVIYLENRSFDNVFGLFPGANGLSNANQAPLQIDERNQPYQVLPAVLNEGHPDPRFDKPLANQPFNISPYVALNQRHPDLIHRFFINQMQINGGRNDKFAQLSNAGGLTMGYYDLSNTALWQYAQEFTLADNFFQAAFGGSFLNHQWLICACTPRFDNPSSSLKHWKTDPKTQKPLKDPIVTDDDYAVNTIQPYYPPYDRNHSELRLPPQQQATIGDRLHDKQISWAWYAGGWDDAKAGRSNDDDFQYHHQPFVYYSRYAPDTTTRAEHLRDKSQLLKDLQSELPHVVFFKPVGSKNQHPEYSSISEADTELQQIVTAIRHSKFWPSTAIIITYDENGGFWDHVAPPLIDRWGPGNRVPAIIMSPFAKKSFVDHSQYDTTSILKLIEDRFDLPPLTDRDANANGLQNAFEFNRN